MGGASVVRTDLLMSRDPWKNSERKHGARLGRCDNQPRTVMQSTGERFHSPEWRLQPGSIDPRLFIFCLIGVPFICRRF